MGDQIVEPFPGREMCDFCSERPTTQIYACKNFLVPRTQTAVFQRESVGAWAACRACAELVDGERWSELTGNPAMVEAANHLADALTQREPAP
jgi:hypothetical protein